MGNTFAPTLEQPINDDFVDDRDSKVVLTALDLIEKSRNILRDDLNRKETLQEELDETWNVQAPTGTSQFPAFLMFQILFNIVTQMRPLDVQLVSETANENTKRRVSAATSYIMDEGGYTDELTQNYGGFWQQVGLGDYFMQVGAKENGLPEFKSGELVSIHFDEYATRLNTNGTGKCTRAVIMFEYGWDRALEIYPQLKDKATSGDIPGVEKYRENDGLEQEDWEQYAEQDTQRKIQIAHYYDITDKARYTIVAGRGATIIFDQKDEDYQFYTGEGDSRENYIPLLQYMTYPTREGMMNAGVLHLVYPIAMKMKELLNKASNHIADNMNPVRIMKLGKQQGPKFLNRLKDAEDMQNNGQKPFVIDDFGGESTGLGVLETLQAANMTGDFERLMDQFDKIIRRFGFNLDRTFSNPNKPLGSVEIDEENQGETIRQIQEQNKQTYHNAILYAIDMVQKNISDDDETSTPVAFKNPEDKKADILLSEATGLEIGNPVYTLGNYAEDLKAHEWTIIVNARTGKYPSQNLERIRLSRLESKLYNIGQTEQAMAITEKLASLDGISLRLTQQQQPAGVGEQAQNPQLQTEQGVVEEVLQNA